jgi:hypothetical protein
MTAAAGITVNVTDHGIKKGAIILLNDGVFLFGELIVPCP